MSAENVALIQRAYEVQQSHAVLGDWSWFFDGFAHEDLELRPAGTYLDAAPSYKGREGWSQFWRDFSSAWEEWGWDPDAFQFFDADDKVVVFARAIGKGKGSGVEVAQEETHVWTVRDGKAQLGVSYLSRAEALEAAGLNSDSA